MSGIERASSARLNVLETLRRGSIEILGLLPFSSNHAFLARVRHEAEAVLAVYKPRRGERPLWDFPHGTLAAREVAAYLVGEALGWHIVPPTVMRADAPEGGGSLQMFVHHDPERHYFVLMHVRGEEMARFAAFDIVINNADRKGGHIIEDGAGKLWGVDHGLSFNVEPKLRTVIWAFGGDPLPDELVAPLAALRDELSPGTDLHDRLRPLLDEQEIDETQARVTYLLGEGRFPEPEGPISMPWPLV